jgi:hypothetical protein
MRAYFVVVFAIALFATAGLTAAAQSTISGAIGGSISDPHKAVVAGATVSVRSLDTNRESITTTDDQARFA